MSLILKTVNENNISVGFNLQYSANEGIKHINLIYLLIKWELDFISVLGMLFMYLCPHLCWKHRELHTLFMYVCSKWNRTSVSFINRDAEHAGFILK